jgi:hypothetical protein
LQDHLAGLLQAVAEAGPEGGSGFVRLEWGWHGWRFLLGRFIASRRKFGCFLRKL